MTDKEQAQVFSRNLRKYISLSGKSQKDVAKALGFNPTTFNTWCMGKILPSLGKIQIIADYFGIGKSALLSDEQQYYFDDETAAAAQELFTNHDLRALFDASRQLRPEDLKMVRTFAERMKETNPDG